MAFPNNLLDCAPIPSPPCCKTSTKRKPLSPGLAMPLLSLPNEILHMIGSDPVLSTSDLSCFCRTNRRLKALLTSTLIRRGGEDHVLAFASVKGFIGLARDALALGARADAVDLTYGLHTLHLAVQEGHRLIAELLLEHGANSTRQDVLGWTALHYAVGLYDRSGPASAGASGGYEGDCMEQVALVQLLLDNGSRINPKDKDETSPLRVAIQRGNAEIVKLLLDNRADVGLGSVSSLQSLAAGSNEEVIFKMLMEWDNRAYRRANTLGDEALPHPAPSSCTRIPENELVSAFLKAASSGNIEVVKFLLCRGIPVTAAHLFIGNTALHEAAAEGHESVAILLLDEGLDVNVANKSASTALHHVKCPGLMALLLERGADPNAKDSYEETPLFKMTRLKAVASVTTCINLLLANGADIEARDRYGKTPLHRAVISSTLEITKLLLQHKACTASQDENGLTPLHWAAMARRPDIIRLLVGAGADIRVRTQNNRTILHEVIQLSTVEMEGCYNERAIWCVRKGAVFYRDNPWNSEENRRKRAPWEEIFKLILDLGADRYAVDDDGYSLDKTALEMAWRNSPHKFPDILTKYFPAKVLSDITNTTSDAS